MKGIDTLIKLKKNELDALTKQLKALQEQKYALEDAIKKLEEEIMREEELANNDINLARYFGAFAMQTRKKIQAYQGAIAEVDKNIEVIRGHITNAFGELKKYEIAKQNQIKQKAVKELHIEQQNMDEVAQRNALNSMHDD